MTSEAITVVNNPAENRFEANVDGRLAVTEYRLHDGIIEFVHTEVPRELEGRGVASHLARAGLGYARAENLRVDARCPFIAAWIRRNPEYQDLVRSPS